MPSEVLSAIACRPGCCCGPLDRDHPAGRSSELPGLRSSGPMQPQRRRPAAGYVRMRPYAPWPRPASLFSPYQSYLPREQVTPRLRHLPHSLRAHVRRVLFSHQPHDGQRRLERAMRRSAPQPAAATRSSSTIPIPEATSRAMVDLTGRAYGSYPTAFKYRKTLVEGCGCRPQPWSETERARHRAYAALPPPAEDADAAPLAEKKSAESEWPAFDRRSWRHLSRSIAAPWRAPHLSRRLSAPGYAEHPAGRCGAALSHFQASADGAVELAPGDAAPGNPKGRLLGPMGVEDQPAILSIACASLTSSSVRPPASCVESVTSTRFQTLNHSG